MGKQSKPIDNDEDLGLTALFAEPEFTDYANLLTHFGVTQAEFNLFFQTQRDSAKKFLDMLQAANALIDDSNNHYIRINWIKFLLEVELAKAINAAHTADQTALVALKALMLGHSITWEKSAKRTDTLMTTVSLSVDLLGLMVGIAGISGVNEGISAIGNIDLRAFGADLVTNSSIDSSLGFVDALSASMSGARQHVQGEKFIGNMSIVNAAQVITCSTLANVSLRASTSLSMNMFQALQLFSFSLVVFMFISGTLKALEASKCEDRKNTACDKLKELSVSDADILALKNTTQINLLLLKALEIIITLKASDNITPENKEKALLLLQQIAYEQAQANNLYLNADSFFYAGIAMIPVAVVSTCGMSIAGPVIDVIVSQICLFLASVFRAFYVKSTDKTDEVKAVFSQDLLENTKLNAVKNNLEKTKKTHYLPSFSKKVTQGMQYASSLCSYGLFSICNTAKNYYAPVIQAIGVTNA